MRRALVAMLAAAAAFAATGPASASVPAHPKWRSADPFGTWNSRGYIVYNNEWNSSYGPQTIWAYSYKHWGVVSTQPTTGSTATKTYPCVQKNFSNVPVRSFNLIRNGFSEYMPSTKAGVDAEAADDVWLNRYRIELMIWVDNHGQRPKRNVIGHATISGQHFAVWHGGTDYTFALNHRENKGVTHILASINWLISHHLIPANVTVSQANFGWEIASTGGHARSFTVKNYWLHTRR